MNYHEKIKRYSNLYEKGLGRWIIISYKRYSIPTRKKDKNGKKVHIKLKSPDINTYHGKIVEIKKASMKILVDDEQLITIGFRTIIESLYLENQNRIMASLYFNVNKPKLRKI